MVGFCTNNCLLCLHSIPASSSIILPRSPLKEVVLARLGVVSLALQTALAPSGRTGASYPMPSCVSSASS